MASFSKVVNVSDTLATASKVNIRLPNLMPVTELTETGTYTPQYKAGTLRSRSYTPCKIDP